MSDRNKDHFLPKDVVKFLHSQHPPGADLLREDDTTVQRAAKVWRCGQETARKRLDALVAEGKMVMITRQANNGKQVNAYRVKAKE